MSRARRRDKTVATLQEFLLAVLVVAVVVLVFFPIVREGLRRQGIVDQQQQQAHWQATVASGDEAH